MPQPWSEVKLEDGCSAVSLDWSNNEQDCLLATGQLDGSVMVHTFHPEASNQKLQQSWVRKHKAPVRRVRFGRIDNCKLYSITSNKALTEWDVNTGKKLRCLTSAHKDAPYSLCPLISHGTKHQCLASGDEAGTIKTWDMRSKNACITTYDQQTEEITDLCMAPHKLKSGVLLATCADQLMVTTRISPCSDATIAAYDLRNRQPIMISEPMHSELNTVDCCPADGRTLVGAADGYIEIFNAGQWGNIINRFQSTHEQVDCLRVVNDQLAVTASTGDGEIRAVHLHPDQHLSLIGTHENGVEELSIDSTKCWLASCGYDDRVKIWNLKKLTESVISMALSQNQRKRKKEMDPNEFYDGLGAKKQSKEESDAEENDVLDDDSDWESDD